MYMIIDKTFKICQQQVVLLVSFAECLSSSGRLEAFVEQGFPWALCVWQMNTGHTHPGGEPPVGVKGAFVITSDACL